MAEDGQGGETASQIENQEQPVSYFDKQNERLDNYRFFLIKRNANLSDQLRARQSQFKENKRIRGNLKALNVAPDNFQITKTTTQKEKDAQQLVSLAFPYKAMF